MCKTYQECNCYGYCNDTSNCGNLICYECHEKHDNDMKLIYGKSLNWSSDCVTAALYLIRKCPEDWNILHGNPVDFDYIEERSSLLYFLN